MKKAIKINIVIMLILGFAIVVISLLQISSHTTTKIRSFALDENGLLYIGQEQRIDVYKQQQLVDSLPFKARSFTFTVHDSLIIAATVDEVVYLDLQGTELRSEADDGAMYDLIGKYPTTFVSDDGKHYQLDAGFFKRDTIICVETGSVIFVCPILDQVLLVLEPICIVMLLISMMIFVTLEHISKGSQRKPNTRNAGEDYLC